MEFRIADSFTSSLARLTGDEQKAVKTTAFDLQMNPANPGMSFHKLDKAKDKNFWSVRVNKDIRLIVHKNENSILICYVDHHDKAYDWAERRKLEIHPATGAAQLVEIRETVKEIFVPVYIPEEKQAAPDAKKLFDNLPDETILSYGVPEEWLHDVKEATEESLLNLVDYLPEEAGEALLELATGGKPEIAPAAKQHEDPFGHPDAQRRFRTIDNIEELQRALEFPWDKWAIFLHPAQRQWVQRKYSGPARVSGSAGTGKTIVALHRAVFLAKANTDARVLLTTFSNILANSLKVKLRRLISNEPRLAERIEIYTLNEVGVRLYKTHFGAPKIIDKEMLVKIIREASEAIGGHKFSLSFLVSEWEEVVDTWQLKTWESYRDVKRLGRKTRLPEQQRAVLWSIFEKVNAYLGTHSLITYNGLFNALAEFTRSQKKFPYDHAVVDEAQDISVCQLRFLAALGQRHPDTLFFAGDLGQRIFQQAFSWKSIGVDIRGRSRTLQVNYRTSHQIRQHADRLLGPEQTDVDGNVEERNKTISIFNGPEPEIKLFESEEQEWNYVGDWITKQVSHGLAFHEIGIFIRSLQQKERAVHAVQAGKYPFIFLDETVETISGKIAISTMHLAKGLEFRSVAVMACDDEVIPLQQRIESITDNADLEEVYNTERHLLYVACTRARDCLLVTAVAPGSEFLEDLAMIQK
jgi:mRNA-degrading endonuclease RelE of RelBE toxin-antitoxin system